MRLKYVFMSFGFIAIILTLMPFIAVDYWWIRMFDFPHVQLTLLTGLAVLTYLLKFDFKNYKDYFFITALIICLTYQSIKIYPYTKLGNFTVFNASKSSKKELSFFTSNVLQENKNYQKVIDKLKMYDSDIMLFTETNVAWQKNIKRSISNQYRYHIEFPLNNTYGMLLYSKLELIEPEVKFLVSDSVPSIHTKVKLKSGEIIQLYAIHPTPPMPQENPMSTDRDAEMMKIALASRDNKLPVVVIGDFNDVAWSQSSKLFNRVSGLLDIRKGRGLFNTFDANSFILRWPLDHIFISNEFRLKKLKVVDDVSSDHFPLYAKLTFEPELAHKQKPFPLTKEDLKTTKKQISKERKMDNDKN